MGIGQQMGYRSLAWSWPKEATNSPIGVYSIIRLIDSLCQTQRWGRGVSEWVTLDCLLSWMVSREEPENGIPFSPKHSSSSYFSRETAREEVFWGKKVLKATEEQHSEPKLIRIILLFHNNRAIFCQDVVTSVCEFRPGLWLPSKAWEGYFIADALALTSKRRDVKQQSPIEGSRLGSVRVN